MSTLVFRTCVKIQCITRDLLVIHWNFALMLRTHAKFQCITRIEPLPDRMLHSRKTQHHFLSPSVTIHYRFCTCLITCEICHASLICRLFDREIVHENRWIQWNILASVNFQTKLPLFCSGRYFSCIFQRLKNLFQVQAHSLMVENIFLVTDFCLAVLDWPFSFLFWQQCLGIVYCISKDWIVFTFAFQRRKKRQNWIRFMLEFFSRLQIRSSVWGTQ